MAKAAKKGIKRPYKKRTPKIDIEKNLVYEYPEKESPEPKLSEIEFLTAVINGLEEMDEYQKARFLNYIHSRYFQYFGKLVHP